MKRLTEVRTPQDWLEYFVQSAGESARSASFWLSIKRLGRTAAAVNNARNLMRQAKVEWKSMHRVEVW